MREGSELLKALFKKHDVRGDGLISQERLAVILKDLTSLSEVEIHATIASVAPHGDEQLSWDAFVDWAMTVPLECEKKAQTTFSSIEVIDIAMPAREVEEREPPAPAGNLPSIVTATRTKFEMGKDVVAEIPHSEGPPLSEFRGLKGTVKGSEMTPDGRVYEVSFDMRCQVRIGSSVLVNGRNAKIIYGPDEDNEYIARFEDSCEPTGCLTKEDFAFPEGAEEQCCAQIPAEYLRTAGALAQSTNVQFLTIDQMLKECKVHTIPVYQRRYCWTERQCTRLWQSIDTMRQAEDDVNNHSIGRLMLWEQPSGARMVLDGQQRLTTLVLVFAALRDRVKELDGGKPAVKFAAELHRLCDGRLVPTLDDRSDFERCLAEPEPVGESALLAAKRVLVGLARSLDLQGCKDMAKATRRRLSVLAFVLDSDQSVQRVYENLAKRVMTLDQARQLGVDLGSCVEAFMEGVQTPATHWGPDGQRICEIHAAKIGLDKCELMTPGVEMSPADLIRNFVIEHFDDEAAMRQAHAEFWSPLETMAGGTAEGLEQLLSEFLSKQGFTLKQRWQLYTLFVAWWRATSAEGMPANVLARERLEDILRVLSAARQ